MEGRKDPKLASERFGIDRRSFGKWVEQLKKYAKIPDENIEIDERIDGGRQKIVVRRLVSLHNDYDSLILERRVSAWQG